MDVLGRIRRLEKMVTQKESVPVLIVVQDDPKSLQNKPRHVISMEQYEAGLFPDGVTEKTVVIIDDVP
mgnify:CR=1 FL=1